MTYKAYRRIPSCDPSLIEAARRFSVADLHESMDIIPGRMALMDPVIRPLARGQRVAGQALTVYPFPGDGLVGHRAIQLAGPGQVLVIANGGCGPMVMLGELVALAAKRQGVLGAVVESCVRDSEALMEMRFPVWSSGFFTGHLNKTGQGSINVPVVCGGIQVEPGDLIVADNDGVICIPLDQIAEVLARASVRAAHEVEVRKAINGGKPLSEIFDIQSVLSATGVVEYDHTWRD